MPSMSWGHGHSPVLNDRPHSLLAVAWGPLIQLVVLIDHEETESPFILDGYYILMHIDRSVSDIEKSLKLPKKQLKFTMANGESLDDQAMLEELKEMDKPL